MEVNLMEEALKWWSDLTEHGKSQFPKPQDNCDILMYYQYPAEYIMPPMPL